MRVVGIIAEYNPFHKGHAYHVSMAKKEADADFVIAVMSGDYVQRGAPAMFDKYERTFAALQGGVDLVLELPVPYATGSSEYFAQGGIRLLEDLSCVDAVAFGSESASISELSSYAELFTEEPPEWQEVLKAKLKQGMNYPKARMEAANQILGIHSEPDRAGLMKMPNHILAIEYLKALRQDGSDIRPIAIRRVGEGYHGDGVLSEDSEKAYASASSIRESFLHLGQDNKFLQCDAHFMECFLQKEYLTWDDFADILSYALRMHQDNLADFFGVSHDLADRMEKETYSALTFEKMVNRIHSKNLTDAAIGRALLHIMLGITDDMIPKDRRVPYARVLGFRKGASQLLKLLRDKAEIPVIQKPVQGRNLLTEEARKLYDLDIRSAEIYEQVLARRARRFPIREYSRQQIIVE